MKFIPTRLPDVIEIQPRKHGDARGFFSETFSQSAMNEAGLTMNWVQDNHSFSAQPHVLRGLHFQLAPFAQDKLIRVVRGRILDVAVDIRPASATFKHWVAVELSAEKWNQLLVPKGFAHGFLTLEPNVEVVYKVSAKYSPQHDRSLKFDDPDIGVNWPIEGITPQLSDKDKQASALSDLIATLEF